MRRLSFASPFSSITSRAKTTSSCFTLSLANHRRFQSSTKNDTNEDETEKQQQEQEEMKKKVFLSDSQVIFASASSSDLNPFLAASEAFDLAHTSLQAAANNSAKVAPNFCFTVITVDHEGMIDIPHLIWRSFNDANNEAGRWEQQNLSSSSSAPTKSEKLMLGCMVRNQRVGGDGFIEVLLGHIPDLRVSSFTFDNVPKSVEEILSDEGSDLLLQQQRATSSKKNASKNKKPPVALGFALADWKLAASHPRALADRLEATAKLLKTEVSSSSSSSSSEGKEGMLKKMKFAPLVGGVLPPAESGNKQDEQNEKGKEQQQEPEMPEAPAASYYFVNGSVFRGSAGAVLLHSNLMQADVMSLTPSVIVQQDVPISNNSEGMIIDESTGVWTITHLGEEDKKTACDFIRQVYENDEGLKIKQNSKLFLGLSRGDGEEGGEEDVFPLSFIGHPNEGGHLSVIVPPFLIDAVKKCKTVSLLRDDADAETDAIATDLVRYEQGKIVPELEKIDSEKRDTDFAFVTESVVVAREKRAEIVAANSCCFHFSHPLLYQIARQQDSGPSEALFAIGGKTMEKHAPSIAKRILGNFLPCSGMHCSGVVLPQRELSDGAVMPPQVMPRASTHVMISAKHK